MSTPGKDPDKSARLFERALELLPGGVNSPVRAFRGVGGTPLFIQSASGPTITDVDGRSFIDYVGSWGPMILGHADAEIVAALAAVAANGTSFGALEDVFKQPSDIAAIIVEPVVGNMGCVPPAAGFLNVLRELSTKHGALLIFDEVMTGFRLARGGAQERYRITPDITCLGKIIGGGLPVGAYGGSRELMRNIAPVGSIYQAGTLSGNPLAMTAGLLTLRRLRNPKIYEQLEERSAKLCGGLSQAAAEAGVKTTTNRVGSMWTTFFVDGPVTNWATANKSNRELYGKFFHAMIGEGVYLAPSQFEAGFVSITHTEEIIEQTIAAARRAFKTL